MLAGMKIRRAEDVVDRGVDLVQPRGLSRRAEERLCEGSAADRTTELKHDADDEEAREEEKDSRPDRDRKPPDADHGGEHHQCQQSEVQPRDRRRKERPSACEALREPRGPGIDLGLRRGSIVESLRELAVGQRAAGDGSDRRDLTVLAGVRQVEKRAQREQRCTMSSTRERDADAAAVREVGRFAPFMHFARRR